MTHLKINFRHSFAFLTLFVLLCTFPSTSLSAQNKVDFRISGAAAIGYAPLITHGSKNNSGVVYGAYGELEYGNIIGRLQFTKSLQGTFKDDNNSDNGEAYHGSLGYRLDVSKKIFIGLLLSGGATVIHYSNGFDDFTNVSPQVGVNIAPAFQITDHLSLQAGLRYYKGFEAGDRGRASDLADIFVALRFSL